MFQRELDLAVRQSARMLEQLDAADQAPLVDAATKHLKEALDAAWRMESALGELLAIEEPKLRATGLVESARLAAQSFGVLKPALAGVEEMDRRSEHEIKVWIESFRPTATTAASYAREAQGRMPPVSSDRISEPVGQADPASAQAVVSIARTSNQNPSVDEVERLIAEALEPLGGIGRFVKEGQTVLLKPNQTTANLADEGATTDPRLVGALARMCRAAGASRVIVGESSGGGSDTSQVIEVTGVALMARRAGAELVNFQSCPQREVDLPDGKVIKRIALPAPLLDADVVINLPKMKTHNFDWISGALKNWVGIVRADVREAHHDASTYDEYTDLLFRVPPTLNVMDAIIRGEGNGPVACLGRFYGGILASADPLALDVVATQVLGFNPAAIGFIQVAGERGLGVSNPSEIAVVGVPLAEAIEPAEPPEMGVDMFDANVIVGRGVTRAGTLGHFKSMGDAFQAIGTWTVVRILHGKPTILIGDAEDPLFLDHLSEGPYVVIDDAAPEHYKHHPGVFFVPGHPVLHNLEHYLLVGLRISLLGQAALEVMRGVRRVESRLELELPRPLQPVVSGAIAASRRLPFAAQAALVFGGAGVLALGLGVSLGRAVVGAAADRQADHRADHQALGQLWRSQRQRLTRRF